MRYLYGLSDEKFVKSKSSQKKKEGPLQTYKFRRHPFLEGKPTFDKNDSPIVFKASPDTLLNMAVKVVDAMPLPSVFEWTNVDVCRWIRQLGYRHYQCTFRENLVTGRKLLLIDAAALSAMNIKNFDDIKHIANGIRSLFFFEMTKFARSISLPPEYYHELYKLFRTQSGRKYDEVRRSDLWRRMQLLRESHKYLSHWELLERWLALERDPKYPEMFGAARRARLYRCKPAPPPPPPPPIPNVPCTCIPPCECYWQKWFAMPPKVLSCLAGREPDPEFKAECMKCMPPCTCSWTSKKFMGSNVLTCLKESFPYKYGTVRFNRALTKTEPALRWSLWDI